MKSKMPYLLIMPAFAFFLLSALWPIILVGHLSLFKTNYIRSVFVGFKNYLKMFSDPELGRILVNAILYTLWIVIGQTIFVLTVAFMIINMKKWVQDTIHFTFYIPTFAVGIIICMTWRWIFHPVAGLANWLLGMINIEPIIWMGDRYIAIWVVSFIITTVNSGMILVIYMTSMLSISTSIFDSARIDGATWFQIKMRIILPMILPTIYLMTLLSMIGGFMIWETIYFMSPIAQAYNLMFDIYRTGFVYSKYGLAAAKSIVLLLIILTLSLIKRRIER